MLQAQLALYNWQLKTIFLPSKFKIKGENKQLARKEAGGG